MLHLTFLGSPYVRWRYFDLCSVSSNVGAMTTSSTLEVALAAIVVISTILRSSVIIVVGVQTTTRYPRCLTTCISSGLLSSKSRLESG